MKVDMYGRHHEFEGRISGFTMGTGSTLAILPAENATGNFIKVVQRLPVRIDPIDYDPDKLPLFIGLSVVPYVYVRETPSGPDAGNFLQPFLPLPTVSRQADSPSNQTGSAPNEMGGAEKPADKKDVEQVKSAAQHSAAGSGDRSKAEEQSKPSQP
jgi:membrane fusion protein (multidrug efflux system)